MELAVDTVSHLGSVAVGVPGSGFICTATPESVSAPWLYTVKDLDRYPMSDTGPTTTVDTPDARVAPPR